MNCKGIFGYLFGHKYKSMIKEKIVPEINIDRYRGPSLAKVLDSQADKKYIICCKRCGDIKGDK